MYSLPHITNTILFHGKNTGVSITPMKLQKLLYYLYKKYLKRTSTPLFSERFLPWQYGPVVTDVYWAFSSYRNKPIESYYPDPDGKAYYIDFESDPILKKCIDELWANYAPYSGIQLSKWTHLPDSAWREAVSNNRSVLLDADILKERDPGESDC